MLGSAPLLLAASLMAAGPPISGPQAASEPPAQQRAQQGQPGQDEEAEEPVSAAEEVTKAGAGVSPVELIPRLELRQSFAQLPGGVSAHVTTTELDIQFLDRLLLRYEGTVQVARTPAGQVSGIGDAEFSAIGLLAASPRFVAVVIGGMILDSASQPPLGTGKKQLLFGAGAAWKPVRLWLPYVVIQEQASVAGDPTRPDVNQLVVRAGSVIFGRGYQWLKLDLDTLVDFAEHEGRFFGKLEAGRLLVGRIGLFMRLGTQLLGTRTVDYTTEVGVRYLFRLGKPKAGGGP
jgi:hypothetical protein